MDSISELVNMHNCERSEAIHLSTSGAMDRFAALAMTMWLLWVRHNNPDGQIAKGLSSLRAKNIPLPSSGKSVI
jgi:hypothetical protein